MKNKLFKCLLFIFFSAQLYSKTNNVINDSIKLENLEAKFQTNLDNLKLIEISNLSLKDSINKLKSDFLISKNAAENSLISLSDSISKKIELLVIANNNSDSLLNISLSKNISRNTDNISNQDLESITLKSSIENLESKLSVIEKTLLLRTNDIENNNNQIVEANNSLNSSKKNGIIIIVIMILLILVIYMIQTKQVAKKQKVILENQISDSQKIADWLIAQSEANLNIEKSGEVDHSFAKRVADQIISLSYNLSKMDDSIRGFKQLNRSVKQLDRSLKSNNYEIVELLNKSYNDGMNMQVDFIPTEDSKKNNLITKIIKPQINYKGKLIQSAHVEVNLNE
jgi:hypothetical protein